MNFPSLPKKGDVEKIFKERVVPLLKKEMIVTITTRNPNNRDVEKDANSNLKFPCYKVEVKRDGELYIVNLYMHVPSGFTPETAMLVVSKDPVTKRQYPDRSVSARYLEEAEK